MNIAQRVAQIHAGVEIATRSAEFLTLARTLVRARGNERQAAVDPSASPRIVEVLKAAIASGSLANPTWAGALSPYRQISDGFVESLRQLSVFDTMLPFMRQVPMHTRLAISTNALVGNSVAELSAKPLGQLAFDAATLPERKAACQVVASKELLQFSSPAATALFNAELRAGVIAATDAIFIAALIALTTPSASAGSSTANIYSDLSALLAAVNVGPQSRLFLVLHPARAKSLVLKQTSGGTIAFPNFTVTGGEVLAGVTGHVSDQISSSAVLLIVADGLAADSDIVTLKASDQAAVQLDTLPSSPPVASTVPFSLFQHDSVCLMAERYFAFAQARTASLASLSGVAW